MACKFCTKTRAVIRAGAGRLADLVRLKRDRTGSKQRHGEPRPVAGQPVSRHSPEGFDEVLEQREE